MARSVLSVIVAGLALAGTAFAQDQQAAAPDAQTGGMPFFQALDADKDGVVTRDEFVAGHQARQQGYMAADTDKDGAISRDEFMQAGQSRREARFKELDADGDGKLSQQELSGNATAMFRNMDANGDGRITPDEMPRRGMGPGMMGPGGAPRR